MRSLRLLCAALLLAAAPAAGFAADATRAQATLPTQALVIVTKDGVRHRLQVEVATSMDQQEVGLMWRQSVDPDGGMLFDWGGPRQSQMWMRNTLVPLDMLFIDAGGVVRHIAERTTPHSLAVIDSVVPVRATLELQGGTAERLDIRVGDRVEAPIFAAATGASGGAAAAAAP